MNLGLGASSFAIIDGMPRRTKGDLRVIKELVIQDTIIHDRQAYGGQYICGLQHPISN